MRFIKILFKELLNAIDEIVATTTTPRWLASLIMLLLLPGLIIAIMFETLRRYLQMKK